VSSLVSVSPLATSLQKPSNSPLAGEYSLSILETNIRAFYGTLEQPEIIIITLGYYLHSATQQVSDCALEATRISHVDDPASIADLLDFAGDISSEPSHPAEDSSLFVNGIICFQDAFSESLLE
jgi:hypothetical protein